MTTFQEQLKPRVVALAVVFVVVLGVLLVRLWSLQIIEGDEFAAIAESNRVREVSLPSQRGRILDRNGVPLVTNRAAFTVTLDPGSRNDEDLLYRLSVALDMPLAEVEERAFSVRETPLSPRTIAVDIPIQTVAYLSERLAEYPGVEVVAVPVRAYPNGALAAHILGYTGEISAEALESEEMADYALGDIVGKSGVELQFESVLQGDKGYRRIEADARGIARRVIDEGVAVPGSDIMLTIDIGVQRVAEEALLTALSDARADEFPDAKAAAAVALDVRTGEVLAMASVPTYDPTAFIGGISTADWEELTAEGSGYPLNNRAIHSQYPPASTFKAITGMAALEAGITSSSRTFVCAGRWVKMGEEWARFCWDRGGHGIVNFRRGVAISCNVYFYELGYSFYQRGNEELQEYARRFGLGSLTGIDLPGEVDGRIPDAAWKTAFNRDFPEYQRWLPGDTVNIAIGQGDMLVTPLQAASVYAGIANNGDVMRPRVLKQVLDSRGDAVYSAETEVAFESRARESDLNAMRSALLAVIDEGTGRSAFRGFGESVAGKTGTAQVAGSDNHAWFIGYAPADEPRYAVAVVIEQGGYGGASAAPAARQIFASLLGLPIDRVEATDVSR